LKGGEGEKKRGEEKGGDYSFKAPIPTYLSIKRFLKRRNFLAVNGKEGERKKGGKEEGGKWLKCAASLSFCSLQCFCPRRLTKRK